VLASKGMLGSLYGHDYRGVNVLVPHKTIDLGTLRCPHLLIATIHAVRELSDGQVLQIYAKDLNAPSSISSWARQSGNSLVEMSHENDGFVFFLQRGTTENQGMIE
jgi:TusA-related sulfurtransferase